MVRSLNGTIRKLYIDAYCSLFWFFVIPTSLIFLSEFSKIFGREAESADQDLPGVSLASCPDAAHLGSAGVHLCG